MNSIDRLTRVVKNQAGDIVLCIESDIPWKDLAAAIRNRVKRSENIKYLTIVKNRKDKRYSREEIIAEGFKIRPADLE